MKILIAILVAGLLLIPASWGMSKKELEKFLAEQRQRKPEILLIFDKNERPVGYMNVQHHDFSGQSACIPVHIVGTISTVDLGNTNFDLFRVEQDGVVFTINILVSQFSAVETGWLPTLLVPQRKVAVAASQCGQGRILVAITVMVLP